MLNEQCGQEYFTEIYSQFDALIDFIDNHSEWTQKFYDIDQEFSKSHENSLYGSPPIGYIDDKKSGKSKKNYFHFTEEYLKFIDNADSELISSSEVLNQFLKSLKEISSISKKKFEEVIQSMSQDVDFSKAMHTEDGKLLILIKVVRYEPSEMAASNLHFDFSGLSFLFDNNEDDGCESLLIAPYKENLTIKDCTIPNRRYKKTKSKSSLLLIPGLALKHIGLPISPTPHAVKKQDKQRYAIIVFAMVPSVKLTYEEIKLRQIKLPKL